ncbi:MAG: hypothetical protein ABW168_10640, partial [Sedimenticola sp.]
MKLLSALLLTLFFTTVESAGDLYFFHPEGAVHNLAPPPVPEEVLWYQPQNRKPYSEFWYYLSVNEAGAVIISHFSLAK